MNEILTIVESVREPLLPIAVLLVIAGLLFAFFGRKIFDLLLFLMGGSLVAGMFIIFFQRATLPWQILLGILGFIIGGFATVYLFYLLIFGVGASIGAFVGIILFHGGNVWADIGILIVAVIFGAIAVAIFQLMLAISTAITGGYVAVIGIYIVTGDRGLATLLGVIIPIVGAIFQIFVLDAFAEYLGKATGKTLAGLVSLPFKGSTRKPKGKLIKARIRKEGSKTKCTLCEKAIGDSYFTCRNCGAIFCTNDQCIQQRRNLDQCPKCDMPLRLNYHHPYGSQRPEYVA